MKVYIDGDACPNIQALTNTAKSFGVPIIIVSDPNHLLEIEYAMLIQVDTAPNSADYEIIGRCEEGDIVLTEDVTLAHSVTAKGARPLHHDGRDYTYHDFSALMATYLKPTPKKKRKKKRRGR